MSSVDDRIVNMQFNNSQFQTGAADSTKSLQTLEQTIAGMGSSTGLTSMGGQVDGIRAKFSALQVAGVTALATIVNKAVNAGLTLVKSMTLDPLLQGFQEYETNLNSIQTIIANTGKSVQVVNRYLDELNEYSDRTIYNFSQMAEAIGKFTAAGVELPAATSAIKGLANTAALSGSNVQQLNTAMYQMSQALSTGVIRLMDWNSLANAGMGGENIRNALMATTRTLKDNGAAMDAAIAKNGDFRTSLSEGWLTAEIFTKTMKVMAGTTNKAGETVAYSVEQLQKMGYETGAAKQLNKLSQAAIDSATKVKTFSQLIDVVKESIGSGWAQVFENLFGNFNQASKLWTGVSESITGVVKNVFDGVNNMLEGWRRLGGYQELWNGFKNIFTAIGNVIEPFVAAFQSLAPSTKQAGSTLHTITKAFETFTGWLVKVTEGLNVLAPVLSVVFAVFKEIASIAGSVFQALAPLADLFGELAGKAGDLAAQGGQIAQGIVDGILQGLDISALKSSIENFAMSIVDWIKGALGIHSPADELIPVGMAIVQGIVEGIGKALSFIGQVMGKVISSVMDGVKQLFSGMDAIDWTVMFNAILTGGLLVMVTRMVNSFKKIADSLTGFIDDIRAPFQQLKDSLKAWQQELKAKMLMDIAIAVGVLVASLAVLSFLPMKNMVQGIGGLAAVMALLITTLATMNKFVKPAGLFSIATSITLISVSMVMLAGAIAALAFIPMENLGRGIGAIGLSLAIMVKALKSMTGLGAGLPAAASAILIMAAAMNLMGTAIAILGNLGMDTIAKGIGAIGFSMLIFIDSLTDLVALGPTVTTAATAILIMASAMAVLAAAISVIGRMKPEQLLAGLVTMGAALYGFVTALVTLNALGRQVIVSAQSILIIAAAMAVLAVALQTIGGMDTGNLVQGLLGLAAAFGILFAAAAVSTIGPIAAGLGILSGAFLAIGAGVALLGAGLLAAATAFAIFTAIGTAGIAVLAAGFTTLMALLPAFAVQLATAFVVFIETIAEAAPRLREAFGTILKEILGTIQDAIPELVALANEFIGGLLDVITTNVPKYGKLIRVLIDTGLKILKDAVPKYVETGVAIIEGVLRGIAKHISGIIDAGTDLVLKFIRGIGKSAKDIVTAAGDTMLDFLTGIRDWLHDNVDDLTEVGRDIAGYLLEGLSLGLLSQENIDRIMNAVKSIIDRIKDLFTGPLGFLMGSPSRVAYQWGVYIVQGLANGISAQIETAVGATVALVNATIAAGDKVIAKYQKESAKKQIAADRAAAKARISEKLAREAENLAEKHPKNKALQKAARTARKQADADAKAAQKAQAAADAAAQKVTNVQAFREADDQGKGDILTARAQTLSDRAVKLLTQANAEAQAAKKLRGKEREEMLKAAREDAKAAKRLADESKEAQKRANEYYAQSVKDRIRALRQAQQAENRAKKEQEAFDAASDEEKAAILKERAEAEQKKADAKQKHAEDLLKAARKLAKKDAAKAQRMIDRAERLAQEAKDAAAQAQQDQEDAQRYLEQDTPTTNTGGGSLNLQLSRSVMEDAASAIDRYTKSLQQAEEAAAAQTPIYQFVQNNTSPESLSDTVIYRQTKNLLSAAEVKMGVNTP